VESFCEYVAILKKGQLALEGKISSLVAGVGYSIIASNLPEAAVNGFRQSGARISAHELGFELQARTREESNQVIDRIRTAGGMVESMHAVNVSLEDVFIRTTTTEKVA
jgi:ABC-type uncharacterized transport system ATPase subunit